MNNQINEDDLIYYELEELELMYPDISNNLLDSCPVCNLYDGPCPECLNLQDSLQAAEELYPCPICEIKSLTYAQKYRNVCDSCADKKECGIDLYG